MIVPRARGPGPQRPAVPPLNRNDLHPVLQGYDLSATITTVQGGNTAE